MFAAVLSSGYSGPGQLIVYGPFATEALARTWIAAQPNPFAYSVACCWSVPPPTMDEPLEPVTISAGNVLAAYSTSNFAGLLQILLYGTFANLAAAEAFIAQQPLPTSWAAVTVETPPA